MTILFLNDWDKYPNAIVDTKTQNESFLKLAGLYKSMGIKNHAFHLALLNPALQGIDPHDPDLDLETKAAIAMECAWNPWYVVREVMKLPPQGGPKPITFKANRGNISMMWCFFNHVDYALIQPRQTGKSASTDVLMDILLFILAFSTKIQLITKDHSLRRENVSRLKGIRDQLPSYLNPTQSGDADNTEMLTCLARENKYLTAVGQKSREAADNLGRGLTAAILHGDELPYIPNIHISLPVALAAGTAARENAKLAGGYYGNIFTTTAGRKDTKEGKFSYNLIHNGCYWNEVMFDSANEQELIKYIRSNSAGENSSPLINGTFSHRQLGKTDQWLRDAIANARASEDLANRDFFNVWSSGSEASPFSIRMLETIASAARDPLYIERDVKAYNMRWYLTKEEIRERMRDVWHVITLDSSNAVGRDANGILLHDIRTMEVIAACGVKEANLYRFAKWLVEFMIKYPKTILVIENKSSAQGIIDTLLAELPLVGEDPFKRIYNRLVDEKEKYEEDFAELQRPLSRRSENFYLKHKGKFGFMTTGNSRAYLYDQVLEQAANMAAHRTNDQQLIDELKGLVDNGRRIDHIEGGHDDLVISWLLGHYFISHSRNLEFYGFNMGQRLSHVSNNGATLTDEQAKARGDQIRLRGEIEDLKQELKLATSPVDKMRLASLIRTRVSKTAEDGGEVITMDSILEDVKEHQSKRNTLSRIVRSRRTAA